VLPQKNALLQPFSAMLVRLAWKLLSSDRWFRIRLDDEWTFVDFC
jgi:hypothetical protein